MIDSYWLMIEWCLIDDFLMIEWWLIDDWLMIDWLIIGDWWLIDDWWLIIDDWLVCHQDGWNGTSIDTHCWWKTSEIWSSLCLAMILIDPLHSLS